MVKAQQLNRYNPADDRPIKPASKRIPEYIKQAIPSQRVK